MPDPVEDDDKKKKTSADLVKEEAERERRLADLEKKYATTSKKSEEADGLITALKAEIEALKKPSSPPPSPEKKNWFMETLDKLDEALGFNS